MRKPFIVLASIVAVALALPALAQQDDRPGHGRGGSPARTASLAISDRDRDAVYDYYGVRRADCPPGLAKKANGCLPPDQARKSWAIGQPLPDDVIYYPLPAVLLGQLTPPPVGYEYVRVANDVLLMAMGTRIIAGAVADLDAP